eukprot:CAMPEP_0171354408 /NCGR_PEP_ID=MMETSP0878-20121228/44693_1 /TAXON_ID=67004 /ORGANISM="Thalassiosira weissflogii, Strain CCMP1336" /LENGTH=670 /DNA_ID=CAMNT_0011860381 /DNA_START=246 /DNA_END=2258 /DNA_ORIENTATION=+
MAMRANGSNQEEKIPGRGKGKAEKIKIAVIGGGAAGLASARACLRANQLLSQSSKLQNNDDERDDDENDMLEVTIFESRRYFGGIWRYDDAGDEGKRMKTKDRPMYRNLRTNLPKELMAFREFPWILDDNDFGDVVNDGGDTGSGHESPPPPPSYVTHRQVADYLDKYAKHFGIEKYVRFGCRVTQLTVLTEDENKKVEEMTTAVDEKKEGSNHGEMQSTPSFYSCWPSISLEWTTVTYEHVNGNDPTPRMQTHRETFHHALICNGHYSLPSFPPIPGLRNFSGRILHAIEYDDPLDFKGQTVVCIGARASGADIAKEIGGVAAEVFLSDSGCERWEEFGTKGENVVKRVPRTSWIDDEGGVHFSSSTSSGKDDGVSTRNKQEWVAKNVDTLIFCSGYDYDFPFINEKSNLELSFPPGERRVQIDDEGGVHFSSSASSGEDDDGSTQKKQEWVVKNVDTLIFCSGYDYDFPFINKKSNLELSFPPGERRVQPLYEQLWHAQYPSVSFIGLPHSVVPFPLFELQANAVVSQLLLQSSSLSSSSLTEKETEGLIESEVVQLPSLPERMEQARLDAASGGPESSGRVQDTHFLGSYQWDYCRKMSRIGGVYDESMEKYIATNKALYDRSGKERKQILPGEKDKYRETRFQRDDENRTYRIIYSEMEEEKSTVS